MLPCTDCSSPQPIYVGNVSSIGKQWCETSPCGSQSIDAQCVVYKGPSLSCTGISTGNTLEWVIQKLDSQICAVSGDYSGYNTACLDDLNPITTQKDFVEGISNYVCTLKTDFSLFTGQIFLQYTDAVDTRFKALEVPKVTSCEYLGITSTDTNKQVLQKLSNKVCDINDRLNLSGVEWDNCFTVDPNPITLTQAFNVINNQICTLRDFIGSGGDAVLPTFDNIGSCLANPSATDSLSVTISKIKNKLCTTPLFNIDALNWSCITKPTGNSANLQGAFQAVMTKVDDLTKIFPFQFSADFNVENIDPNMPCAGKKVSLTSSAAADRYVAVNMLDTTPGTLDSKLQAGTNISFDYSVLGKVIINAGASANDKVKTRSADTTSGYLEEKITNGGASSGVSIGVTTNPVSNKLEIAPIVNKSTLFTALLNQMASDAELKTLFCDLVQSCLPDCVIPPDVTYIVNPTTSTTTSTTTTNNPA